MADDGGVKAFSVFGEVNLAGMPGVVSDLARFEDSGQQVLKTFLGIEGSTLIIGAAIGAVGTAFLVAAGHAATFADQIDRSVLQAAEKIPGGTAAIGVMRDKIVELGQDVPIPLQTLANGLKEAAIGAQSPADALARLTAAAKLSAATGEDLSSVLHAQELILRSYNLSASDAGRVTDLLAVASHHVRQEDLESILQRNAAAAHAAGIPLEQLMQFIVQLSESGVNFRQIGAIISVALAQTQTEAQLAASAFGRLPARLVETNGAWHLVGQGANFAAQAHKEVADAAGTTDKELADVNKTAGAQEQIVRNELSKAWLDFGTQVLPALTGALHLAGDAIDYFFTHTSAQRIDVAQWKSFGSVLDEIGKGDNLLGARNDLQGLLGEMQHLFDLVRGPNPQAAAAAFHNLFKPGDFSPQDLDRIVTGLDAMTDAQSAQVGVTRREREELENLFLSLRRGGNVLGGLTTPPKAPPVDTSPVAPTADQLKAGLAAAQVLAQTNEQAAIDSLAAWRTSLRQQGILTDETNVQITGAIETMVQRHNQLVEQGQQRDITAWRQATTEEQALAKRQEQFLVATGQETADDRIAALRREVAAWGTSSAQILDDNDEIFRLTEKQTQDHIQAAQTEARVDREAALASLRAWQATLQARGDLYPAVRQQIERTMTQIQTQDTVKAQQVGDQIGKELVGGMIRGIISKQSDLLGTLLGIIENVAITALTNALFPGAGAAAGAVGAVRGSVTPGIPTPGTGPRGPGLDERAAAGVQAAPAVTAAGAAPAAPAAPAYLHIDMSGMPGPKNPVEASRDADWIKFFSSSMAEYRAAGGR